MTEGWQDNKSGSWSVLPEQAWILQCEGKMVTESVWVEAILPCLSIQRWFLVSGVQRNKCCMCKTTPSAVNLESPWRNVRRDGCSYGSHAISITTIQLQVLSSFCHSEVRNSQQLQQNSFNFSKFCFNTVKMLLLKMPMTRHIFHMLVVNTDFAFRFHHRWNRRKCRLVGTEVKSPLSQISSKPPCSHTHHLQLLVATVTFSQQLGCQHLLLRGGPFP